jgi:hyperosmotically inducible protein
MRPFRRILYTALLAPVALMAATGLSLHASDDTRIESSIRSSYNFKKYLSGDNISVTSSDGIVTLSGTVTEDYHRTLAEETASNIPGVKRIQNNLQVKSGQPAEHSDAWVTMKVKGALAFHRNVSATGTEVETTDGVVTLKGKAATQAQRELTTEYAKDVEGVKEVRNLMTVSGVKHTETVGEKIDDSSITAQIKTSLLFHRSTHTLATKVTTKNGVVSLKGEANNAAEKDLVGKLAEDIHGVKKVDNHMTVKGS